MELYKQSLEISRHRGDQEGIAVALNNMALIHNSREEYDEALSLGLQAYKILKGQKSSYLQSSIIVLDNIKNKMGNEALVEKYEAKS